MQNTKKILTKNFQSFGTQNRIDHDFDWENPKILDIAKHYQKRLMSEMINIKAQKNAINL